MSIVKLRKKWRDFFLSWIVQFLFWFFQILPRSTGIFFGGLIGIIAFSCLPRYRRITLVNLHLAFGRSLSREKIHGMGKRVFIAFGKNFADVLRIPKIHEMNIDEIVDVRGMERFDKVFQKGKGIIVITGHLGCWELIPAYFSLKGYPINVIGRNLPENRINGILQGIRNGKNIRVIDKGSSLLETVRCLKRGETLGILMDLNTRSDGFDIDFFGKPAHTPSGPILLSYKTGAPLLPLAIHRTPLNRHRIVVGEEIQAMTNDNPGTPESPESASLAWGRAEKKGLAGGSGSGSGKTKNKIRSNGVDENQLKEMTFLCSKAIETFIRQHPTEWFWMHEKWKERK